MSVKRINSPESAIILREIAGHEMDYKHAAYLTGLHPCNARKHLKALNEARMIHIDHWTKDAVKTGPYWPVFADGDGKDAPYPKQRAKRETAVRRRAKQRPHVIDPILAALTGGRMG